MNSIDIIDEHIVIRDTVGYDLFKNIEIEDVPSVLSFLQIVYNYDKMTNIKNKSYEK